VSLDQVRAYFGFTKIPFGKSLFPSALYRSAGHQEAMTRLTFLVSEQAIGVLTGEVGSDKSVAARATVAGLDPSRRSVVYLANPAVGTRGLYAEVVSRLGGEPRSHKAALISQATSLLAPEASERGRAVPLLVDESHLLDSSQLEGAKAANTVALLTARRSTTSSGRSSGSLSTHIAMPAAPSSGLPVGP